MGISNLQQNNSAVKSVQSGSALFGSTTTTVVNISAVDVNKSFVLVNATGYGSNSTTTANSLISGFLTSPTTLSFAGSNPTGMPFRWQVIEYK